MPSLLKQNVSGAPVPAWLADPLPPTPPPSNKPGLLSQLGDYAIHDSIPAKMLQSAWSGFTLPGDVLAGKADPMDMGRAMDFAGLATGGAGVVPAEANELRAGMNWLRQVPDDPVSVTAPGKDPTWFHGVGGGVKLKRPVDEMTSTMQPTGGVGLLTQPRSLNPEDIPIGSTLMPLYGDKTIAGQTLTHINDVPLRRPQELQGGARFMQEFPGSIWASEKGAITNMANKVRRYGQDNPVYGVHTAMGSGGGDFARMTTRPLLDMAQKSNLSTDALKAFDEEMLAKTGGRWPGLMNAGDDWVAEAPGGHRALLAQTMSLGRHQAEGLPQVAPLRKAITDPELLNRPMLTSGRTVGEFDPSGKILTDPAKLHDTYNTQIAGNYLGDIGAVPPEIMWPDVMAQVGGNQLPQIGRKFMAGDVSQKVTPEWQDRIMTYLTGRQ